MKISRIQISNYRGISARDIAVPASGFSATGRNGAGKTSIINAIRAALAARDISADAIRQGADKAEIVVNIDDVTVRRVITPKSSTVAVTTATGFRAPKPQHYLTELIGTAPLDPLDIFLAKPKDRRAIILAALPVKVTREQIASALGGLNVDELLRFVSLDGHGLEVCEKLVDQLMLIRRDLNSDVKRTRAKLDAQPLGPPPPAPPAAPEAAVRSAQTHLAEIRGRVAAAASAGQRSKAARDRIASLRESAARLRAAASEPSGSLASFEQDVLRLDDLVSCIERELVTARRALAEAKEAANTRIEAERLYKSQLARAAEQDAEATALESTIASMTEAAPEPEAIANAEAAVAAAIDGVERARAHAAWQETATAVATVEAGLVDMTAKSDVLTQAIDNLRDRLPAQLLASTGGIAGLSIVGENVTLDGRALDALCGAEQMKIAIEIARRANAKSKILVVDGLERIDPELRESFVEYAISDGYQLLATRVDRGDVVIEALSQDESVEDAAQ